MQLAAAQREAAAKGERMREALAERDAVGAQERSRLEQHLQELQGEVGVKVRSRLGEHANGYAGP